jgi:hypothetical protein
MTELEMSSFVMFYCLQFQFIVIIAISFIELHGDKGNVTLDSTLYM